MSPLQPPSKGHPRKNKALHNRNQRPLPRNREAAAASTRSLGIRMELPMTKGGVA